MIRMDLTDQSERRRLFQQIGADSRDVLIVTEGLLVYLTDEQVIELGRDLAAQPPFRWWLIDLASPTLLAFLKKWFSKTMDEGGVTMKFAPEEGPDFFRKCGWKLAEFRRTMPEAQRLNRQMPGMWLWRVLGIFTSRQKKEGFLNVGTVLLEKI